MSKSPLKKNGYFMLNREIWNDPILTKDSEYLLVWLYILSSAEWEEGTRVEFGGEIITLKPGQFTVGVRNQMYRDLQELGFKSGPKKLRLILEKLKKGTLLGTQKSSKCTLFTVLSWNEFNKKGTQKGTRRAHEGHTKGAQRAPNELNKINKEIKEKEKEKETHRDIETALASLSEEKRREAEINLKKLRDIGIEGYIDEEGDVCFG